MYHHSPDRSPAVVDAVKSKSERVRSDSTCFTTALRVYNYSGMKVAISERNGLTHQLEPLRTGSRHGSGILIVKNYTSDRGAVNFDSSALLSTDKDDEKKILNDCMEECGRTGPVRLSVDYWISSETLKANGGLVYVPEVDMQFDIFELNSPPPHPFSLEGMEWHAVMDNDFFNDRNTGACAFRLVDNQGMLGSKYINLANYVYEIKPVKDPASKSGLYVFKNNQRTLGYSGSSNKMDYVPIEDIDETCTYLYDDYQSALSLGDVKEQQRLDLERRDFELRASEQELKRDKMKLEHEMTQLKREQADLKNEADRLAREHDMATMDIKRREQEMQYRYDTESLRRKSDYEDRSHSRKDHMESIKLAIGIASAVVSVITLLKQNSK